MRFNKPKLRSLVNDAFPHAKEKKHKLNDLLKYLNHYELVLFILGSRNNLFIPN